MLRAVQTWTDDGQELGGRAGPALDLASVLVLALLIGWVLLLPRPGDGTPLAALLLLAGAVYGVARMLSGIDGALVPAAIVAAGLVLAVVRADVLLASPVPSALGYSNATAAFYLVVSAAAWVVVARGPWSTLRSAAGIAAVGAMLVPWLNGSTAAAMLTLLPPLGLVVRPLGGRVRRVVAFAGALALLGVTLPIVLASTFTGEGAVDRVVTDALSARRPQLWGDAVDLLGSAPLLGVGVGGFRLMSPTASADADAGWAHHEILQVAAETGLPAGLLALVLLVCLLARMWAGPRDPGTAVIALGLACLSITASIDYVLHYVPVVVAGAALAGAAPVRTGRPAGSRSGTARS